MLLKSHKDLVVLHAAVAAELVKGKKKKKKKKKKKCRQKRSGADTAQRTNAFSRKWHRNYHACHPQRPSMDLRFNTI
jgi:hypothetical protein